jgi:hypothetical protein
MGMLDLIVAIILLYFVIGLLLYWKDYKAQPMTANTRTIYAWPSRYW